MKIIYSHLKKLLPGLDISNRKVINDLVMIGHWVGGIEEKKGEVVFDLDIKQNRGDCLGYYGIAKDLSVLYGIPLQTTNCQLQTAKKSSLPIEILATKEVKRIQAIKVSNLKNKSSPDWLKEFLTLHEINSLDCLVDITNFIMLWYGIPCHAFDTRKSGSCLTWELADKKYQEMDTFDGTNVKLQPDTLVISNKKNILSLSMIGGQNSGIDLNTTETIVEMAIYDRIRVRRDAKGLKIITEAATRLEKDLDTELIPQAFAHLITMILKNCGGEISSQPFEVYNDKPKAITIGFDPKEVSNVAGINIPEKFSLAILEKLDCKMIKKGKKYEVIPPTLRKDITLKEDLIEEIVRFYGYDKIPANQPIGPKQLPDITPPILYLIDAIKNILVSLGYDEVRNWPIIREEAKVVALNEENKRKRPIYTENSVNEEYPLLRTTLFSSLAEQKKQYDKLKVSCQQFFEVGKVYWQNNDNKTNNYSDYHEQFAVGLYQKDIVILEKHLEIIGNKLNVNIKNLPIRRYPKKYLTASWKPYVEINLEALLPLIKKEKLRSIKPTNLGESAIELTSQIIDLDANVVLPRKENPEGLIKKYSEIIGEKYLWQLVITDVYKDKKAKTFKYTFRAYYYNCDDKTAKRIHLKAFGLASND